MQEIYKEHPRFAVLVSNKGNVQWLDKEQIKLGKDRYKRISVVDKNTFKIKKESVHRLVVQTFISEIPKNMVVNHKDGNKHNNNLDNLEIVTPSQNLIHAIENGLFKAARGEATKKNKVSELQVLEIIDLIKEGYNNQYIADRYWINFRTVSLIRNGDRWKHLLEGYEIVPSNGTNRKLDFCFEVMDNLPLMSNKEIADKFKLEPSLVSRVRSKKTWLKIWDQYNKRATTISKESTAK